MAQGPMQLHRLTADPDLELMSIEAEVNNKLHYNR